jgi:RND family efflux transporter MFP subunit
MIKTLARKLLGLDRRKQIGGGVIVLVALAFGVWWLQPKSEVAGPVPAAAAVQPDESELPAVSIAKVKSTRIAPQASYPGTVVSRNDSRLAADVEGRVEWVADVGTIVKEGDVVARLDANLARMQQEADRAQVAKLAAQVRYDRGHAQRMQELMDKKVVSRAGLDQATSARDANEAALKQAEAALKRSQYQLDHSEIRAPFSGRVVSRLINAGEYASPGKEVVRLVDLDAIEISTQVPIASMQYLREGMRVTAEMQGKPVAASVRVIVPVGHAQSRTVEVRLALEPGSAFVGDAARVLIPSAEPRMVMAVPRDALVLREENTYLFKLNKENKAERIAVEVGAADGNMVEVTGLLREGERVIIRGAERLESGQKVRLVT